MCSSTRSQRDLAVLNDRVPALRLPSPVRRLSWARAAPAGLLRTRRAARAFPRARAVPRAPRYLEQLIAAAAAHADFDVDLVPVAIFWGRAPQKELSLWRLLFAEDWAIVRALQASCSTSLFNGRNTLVYFGEPLRLRDALQEGLSAPRAACDASCAPCAQACARSAPRPSDPICRIAARMVAHILKTQAVRQAVRREMQSPCRATVVR